MPSDEADVSRQPDHDREVTLIYFGFIKPSKAPAPAKKTWEGNSKRSLYNDQLPEPTEVENTAYRGLRLFLREQEPPGAKGTQNSQCPLLAGCWPTHLRRGSLVTVAATNQPGTITGDWVTPGVYAGTLLGTGGGRDGDLTVDPSRKSHQEVKIERLWATLTISQSVVGTCTEMELLIHRQGMHGW